MKIAIIGKFYTEGFGLHLAETIDELGHSAIRIDPEINLPNISWVSNRIQNISKTLYQEVFFKFAGVRNYSSKKIYNNLRQHKIDFVISLHDFLSRDEVKKIKEITKSPVAIWFPDAISNFKRSMFFYAGYDYYFFKDKYLVNLLRDEFNLNTFYLPQCCNPNRHKKVELTEDDLEKYSCEITNAGNLYPSRAVLLAQLLEYKIKLWGKPPPIWLNTAELNSIVMNKEVFNTEKSKAFASAKIVLNNLHPAEINGVNTRTFEIPACGGFQIVNYRECLPELFELNEEIVTYNSFGDLKEKLDFYLDPKNINEKNQIAEAGYKRVLKDHTYVNRINRIIEVLQ